MDKCTKCNGIMLIMKVKKSVIPDSEKKQVLKCSRCGYYVEKQQAFMTQHPDQSDEPLYLRRR